MYLNETGKENARLNSEPVPPPLNKRLLLEKKMPWLHQQQGTGIRKFQMIPTIAPPYFIPASTRVITASSNTASTWPSSFASTADLIRSFNSLSAEPISLG